MNKKWLIVGALLAAVGCTEGEDDPRTGQGGMGGSGGSDTGQGGGGEGGSGGEQVIVPDDEFDTGWTPEAPAALDGPLGGDPRPESCGEEFQFLSAVRGWVVAPGGKALESTRAQLCINSSAGKYVCLSPSIADEEGVYTVDVPEEFRCIDSVAMRLVLPRSNRATSYCLVEDRGPVARLHEPGVLPFLTPATELPPLGDEDAPREVVFDGGLVLEVTPSLYFSSTGSYQQFSGRAVPTDAVGLCGDAPTFDGLFAFYPEGSIIAPGFPLRIENTRAYPAGAAVELFVLGGLDCTLADGTKVPEAEWARFGEGTVSEDGTTIVAGENSGLPCFTWLAYRLKE